jgi:hypothetical protein
MLTSWPTVEECKKGLSEILTKKSMWYSAPIGCPYNGNSFLRVRITNALFGGSELGCIAESGYAEDAKRSGILYGPVLGRTSPRPPDSRWHCVDLRAAIGE